MLVTLFFAVLWTPLIGMLFGVGNFRPGEEGRRLAPLPTFERGQSWFALADAFTAYFHDHFGFRGSLITAHALFKVKALGVSSSADVVLGKDGWLFYAGDKSMENHRGVLPFSAEELARWVQLFKKREDWLTRRGIPMIVAIVPDKVSVYPEFLPSSFRKVREQTRLDVLKTALPVIDLRPALRAAKRPGLLLYSPTDTHWTANGAYVGYEAIVREMKLQPVPYPPLPETLLRAGDLATMLGLGEVWRDVPEDPPWPRELRGSAGRLMVYGDSFSSPLIPYLSRHFANTIVSRSTALQPAMISERHPDVVLIEMVERMLNLAPPQDPNELTEPRP